MNITDLANFYSSDSALKEYWFLLVHRGTDDVLVLNQHGTITRTNADHHQPDTEEQVRHKFNGN